MKYKLIYKPYGEHSILIEWPKRIDTNILHDIINFKKLIKENDIKSLVKITSSYSSLLIFYNEFISGFDKAVRVIDKIYHSNQMAIEFKSNLWKIPVCYDKEFGLDLDLMSKEKGLSKSEIITLHSQATYTVYFIGFLPGFLYLGGLNEKLYTPRKSTPRLQIEKGAVAIGGNQTGVYPNISPGGWNIIGNSPINFFNASKTIPCFAKAGDQIQFYPITLKEYQDIKTLVNANVYQIESEVVSD